MQPDPNRTDRRRATADYGADEAYFGVALAALNQVNFELTNIFNDAGFQPIEPAILQPADPLFDLYGEEIWERAFILEDAEKGSLCLRPDFTVPVARAHVAGAGLPEEGDAGARYGYFGPVFRRAPYEDAGDDQNAPGPSPIQHLQAGVEVIRARAADLSDEDRLKAEAAEDAEVFDLAAKALKWAGVPNVETVVGDLGVIFAILDGVEMPASWRKRLKRHFWRPARFQQLLRGFAGDRAVAAEGEPGRAAFLRSVGGLAPTEAEGAVLGMIAQFEIPQIGVRSAAEAAERFLRLSADAAEQPLSPDALSLIEDAIAVKGPWPDALERLKALDGRAGVDLGEHLACMSARIEALEGRGVDVAALSFDAAFGRNLEYYDGFVFEMRAPDPAGGAPIKLGGGGRYDRLFDAMKAEARLSGVGAAVRPEAVVAAKSAQTDDQTQGAAS